MIVMDKKDKNLTIPSALGNFGNGGGTGGITPEEAAEIASAITEEAIDEYDTELQVELEEIREAISGNTDTLLDLSEIAAMSVADRIALFDEVYEKASNGEKVYIKGLVQEETIRTAILPLVSYRPETSPALHQGGNLYFAAKGDTDNIYFHIGLTSEGQIDPTSGNIIKRNIYNLPTASAEVKGGVKVGSGLTMVEDTLMVDGSGFATKVELSAVTSSVEALSGATENVLSDIETLSGVTEDTYGAIFYEEEGQTYSQIDDLWSALDDKQDVLEAGSGISIDSPNISVNIGPGLTLDNKGHNQVMAKLGDGMRFGSGDTISLNIGEGLGFSGDTLVVSGGTGGGYVIADTFDDIDNPEEGTMAYVKGYNVSGWTIDATPFGDSEGFCAYVHYDGTSSKTNIYYAGGQFHWSWNNDQTTWGPGQNINYKIDKANKLFYVYCDNADAYIEPASPATATITPTVFNIPIKELYLNNGTDWEQKDFVKLYFLDNMSNAERAALYDEITSYTDHTFPAWKYRFYVGSYDNDEFLGNFEVFVARFESHSIQLSGLMSSRYDPTLLMRGYTLQDNGGFSKSFEANKTFPNPPYDAFLVASYDNDMCLTGITHDTKANMWEGYKQEGGEYVRKTVVAYVHTGDNLPARFHLIHAEGDFSQDEDNAELHFGAVYNSVGDAALHSVRFRLTKDTANDVYTIDNIVEYTYNSQ